MRVLLDENMPQRFRRLLGEHEVFTVAYMGWKGKQNGDLIAAMKEEKFQALITYDFSLPSQQNLQNAGIGVIVVVIHPKRYQKLRDLAPAIVRALDFLRAGQVVHVPSPNL